MICIYLLVTDGVSRKDFTPSIHFKIDFMLVRACSCGLQAVNYSNLGYSDKSLIALAKRPVVSFPILWPNLCGFRTSGNHSQWNQWDAHSAACANFTRFFSSPSIFMLYHNSKPYVMIIHVSVNIAGASNGGSASCSNQHSDRYRCSNAIDEDLTLCWNSWATPEGVGAWIRVDFNDYYCIEQVRSMSRIAHIDTFKDVLITFTNGFSQQVDAFKGVSNNIMSMEYRPPIISVVWHFSRP